MQPSRLAACLLFAFGSLGTPLVPAEDTHSRTEPLRSGSVPVLAAVPSMQEAPPPAPASEGLGELTADAPASLQLGDLHNALTLDDLERMAEENNPTLLQASMKVKAARGRYLQAGLYPNPAIGYAGADMGLEHTSGQQGGTVSQEIVTFGKLRLAQATVAYEIEQADCAWQAQQRRVFNDVRAGYYAVLLANKTVDANEQLVRIGEKGVQVTEKLRAAKEVSQADVYQARIEADAAKLSLKEAGYQSQAAWRRLSAVLGRPDLVPHPLIGDVETGLPEFTWEDTLIRLLTESPEVALAQAGVQRARRKVALQWANRMPNVQIGAGVKHDETVRMTLADAQVSLSLPLINRNQGNIAAAQAELVAAAREVERVELDLRNRLAETFRQYANARQQVKVYSESILPNAKASLELISTGYREGEFGYLKLLTAQRTYFSVTLDYVNSLRELWARSVEIEGLLLTGGLNSND